MILTILNELGSLFGGLDMQKLTIVAAAFFAATSLSAVSAHAGKAKCTLNADGTYTCTAGSSGNSGTCDPKTGTCTKN